MAIVKYFEGTPLDAKPLLVSAESGIKAYVNYPGYTEILTYNAFISGLIKWYEEHALNGLIGSGVEKDASIYFAGESHSLTCINKNIQIGSKEFTCRSSFIPDCKIWDLVNNNNNSSKYKRAFSRELSMIPPGSLIVLTIGEIDTRIDAGVFKVYLNKNVSWKDNVNSLVACYLDQVISHLIEKGYVPVVWGIPAPHQLQVSRLQNTHRDEYIEFVRYINQKLKQICDNKKIYFIDNYKNTVDQNGLVKDGMKFDHFHLNPDVFVQAIKLTLEGSVANKLFQAKCPHLCRILVYSRKIRRRTASKLVNVC